MLVSVGKLKSPRKVISAGGGGGAQFLKSQGLTGAQGFTLNTRTVSKDMSSQLSTRNVPSGFNPKSPAGLLTPTNQSDATRRTFWSDWGDDIFDAWGDFYIFNPADQTATYIELPGAGRTNFGSSDPLGHQNRADESFFTEVQTHHSKTFKIVHGWATQGIFKLDVSCTSDETFQFALGHYGNMGSDTQTINEDKTHSASWGTLHYNFNSESNRTDEFFYTHVIPKKKTDNDSINVDTTGLFTAVSGNDNLAIWTGYFTHGFTCYYVKGQHTMAPDVVSPSMANWVANDIALSATYHD